MATTSLTETDLTEEERQRAERLRRENTGEHSRRTTRDRVAGATANGRVSEPSADSASAKTDSSDSANAKAGINPNARDDSAGGTATSSDDSAVPADLTANSATAPLSETIVAGLAAIVDVMMIVLPGLVIFGIYVGWDIDHLPFYLAAISVYALVTVQSFYVTRLYSFNAITLPVETAPRIVTVCTVIFLLIVTLLFALKISTEFSRIWAFSWFLSATTLVCVGRAVFYAVLMRWANKGLLSRNVVLVGGGEQARRLLAHLDESKKPWIRVVGIFDDRLDRIGPAVSKRPILGNVDSLVSFARKNRVDDIIVTLPWNAEHRVHSIIERLSALPVQIRLASDLVGLRFHKHEFSSFNDVPMLDVVHKPVAGWKRVLKVVEDFVLATLIMLVLGPIMIAIGIAIKFDSPGPVFFKQRRFGFNNQVFDVYKFRTMYHNHEIPTQGVKVQQATRDDPRVTRVGKILRSWSLDELPQLLNVLNGTMSIVGPRPHAVEHNEQYSNIIAGYYARHRVKPGMTGLAQIHGYRGETGDSEMMRKRIEYDVRYIENWSVGLDLEILLKTPLAVLSRENAY